MSQTVHALNWFEIPVTDFARAKAFYEAVLGIRIAPMAMGATMMGMLSSDPNAVGGAIVQGEGCVPSQNGTMVFLNGGDDLAPMLARVAQVGHARRRRAQPAPAAHRSSPDLRRQKRYSATACRPMAVVRPR